MARVTLTQRVDELTVEVGNLKTEAAANVAELKEGQAVITRRIDAMGLNGHKPALIAVALAAPALVKLAEAAPELIAGVTKHQENAIFNKVLGQKLRWLAEPKKLFLVFLGALATASAYILLGQHLPLP